MRLSTVNVIEMPDMTDRHMTINAFDKSWHAEKEFVDLIREHEKDVFADVSLTDKEIDICLDNGYYQDGVYYLALIHSI